MNLTQKQIDDTVYKSGLPCWRDECGSSDAVALYLDGKFNNLKYPRVKCFSCGESTTKEEIVEQYIAESIDDGTPTKTTTDTANKTVEHTGDIHQLKDRGISKEAALRYNVKTNYNASGLMVNRSYPFTDNDGQVIASKIKTPQKKMFSTGDINRAILFGQSLFPAGSNEYVTITEGEEDALAVWDMLRKGTFESVVVSVKNGAQSATREVEQNYEWLNSFKEIKICFDMDEQGQKAAAKVAKKFPGKCSIVKMTFKDANEYLKAGQQEKFKNHWHNAEKSRVKGVYEFDQLWDEMTKTNTCTTIPYPWEELQNKTYGMRTGELTIIKAPPKIGKTELLREIAFHIQDTTDFHTGVVFLEEGLQRISQGFVSKELNKPVHLPDTIVSDAELRQGFDAIAKKGQLHIFDPRSDITVENLFDKMDYFVHAKGCKLILLDHISMFAYKAQSFDERRFLDGFIADLASYAHGNDVHIVGVIHVNDDGKTRGSRAPVQLCNTLISIHRDKLNPDETIANTTQVIVEENRFNGDSGQCLSLLYDRETGRMIPISEDDIFDDDDDIEIEPQQVEFGD
jgi:twinkle protein